MTEQQLKPVTSTYIFILIELIEYEHVFVRNCRKNPIVHRSSYSFHSFRNGWSKFFVQSHPVFIEDSINIVILKNTRLFLSSQPFGVLTQSFISFEEVFQFDVNLPDCVVRIRLFDVHVLLPVLFGFQAVLHAVKEVEVVWNSCG